MFCHRRFIHKFVVVLFGNRNRSCPLLAEHLYSHDAYLRFSPSLAGAHKERFLFLMKSPTVRVILGGLHSTEVINKCAETEASKKAGYKSNGLDPHGKAIVAWVHNNIFINVWLISLRVDVLWTPVKRNMRFVVGLEKGSISDCVDLALVVCVLAVLVGRVEYLILPHIQIENHNNKYYPIIEPFACNENA